MQVKYYQCVILAHETHKTPKGNLKTDISITQIICNAYDEEGAKEAAIKLGNEIYTDKNNEIKVAVQQIHEQKLRALLDGENISILNEEGTVEFEM